MDVVVIVAWFCVNTPKDQVAQLPESAMYQEKSMLMRFIILKMRLHNQKSCWQTQNIWDDSINKLLPTNSAILDCAYFLYGDSYFLLDDL